MPKGICVLDVRVLEDARLAKGLLKREVREQAGISKSSMHIAFSSGSVGIRVAREIARVLDLDLADLWVRQGAAHHG